MQPGSHTGFVQDVSKTVVLVFLQIFCKLNQILNFESESSSTNTAQTRLITMRSQPIVLRLFWCCIDRDKLNVYQMISQYFRIFSTIFRNSLIVHLKYLHSYFYNICNYMHCFRSYSASCNFYTCFMLHTTNPSLIRVDTILNSYRQSL